MTDKGNISLKITGTGPHDLPQMVNPRVRLHESGKYVGIEGEIIDPATGQVASTVVRVTLSPKDAMLLLSNLQSLALDQDYETPKSVGHVVQDPEKSTKH